MFSIFDVGVQSVILNTNFAYKQFISSPETSVNMVTMQFITVLNITKCLSFALKVFASISF